MAATHQRAQRPLKPLRNQVMVITGATSGIGLATARLAATRGARLALFARSAESLQRLCDELNDISGGALGVSGDVANEDDMRRLARETLERFGGFDTWVNNAGVTIFGELDRVSMEDMHRLFDTNFWGVVHGSRIAVEHLRSRGGALINMGSIASDRAVPLQGVYSASKHAVKAYTDALRMELEHRNAPVSVTLIKPASIDTPYTHHARNYLGFRPRNPPPVYSPRAVAEAILFCAENRRRDVTIGASGLLAVGANVMPRAADEIMEQTFFDMQISGEPTGVGDVSNLHRPAGGLQERSGDDTGAMASSWYTRATLNAGVPERFRGYAGNAARLLWQATRWTRGGRA